MRQRNTQSAEYLNATYEEPSRYQPTSNIYLGVGANDISKHLNEHQQEPNSGITQEPPAYETLIQTHPTPTEPPTYENPTYKMWEYDIYLYVYACYVLSILD